VPLAGCSFDLNTCLLQSSTRDSDGRPDSGTMSELGNRRRKGTSRQASIAHRRIREMLWHRLILLRPYEPAESLRKSSRARTPTTACHYSIEVARAVRGTDRRCDSDFDSRDRLRLHHRGEASYTLIRLQPILMLVGISHHDYLISSCVTHQLLQPRLDRRIRSYNRGA
jgi:hypothetical protein